MLVRRTVQPPVLLIITAFPVLLLAVTCRRKRTRRTRRRRRRRRRTVVVGSVRAGSVLPPQGGVTEWFSVLTPVTRPAVLAVSPTNSAVSETASVWRLPGSVIITWTAGMGVMRQTVATERACVGQAGSSVWTEAVLICLTGVTESGTAATERTSSSVVAVDWSSGGAGTVGVLTESGCVTR